MDQNRRVVSSMWQLLDQFFALKPVDESDHRGFIDLESFTPTPPSI
jgi:hypothetical protein